MSSANLQGLLYCVEGSQSFCSFSNVATDSQNGNIMNVSRTGCAQKHHRDMAAKEQLYPFSGGDGNCVPMEW